MQVVKIIISILPLLVFCDSYTQDINGKYESKSPIQKVEYIFDDNTFSIQSSGAFDHGINFSKGYYLIKNDTLLLFYDSIKNIEFSQFVIKTQLDSVPSIIGKKPVDSSGSLINLNIRDTKGNKIPDVLIAIIKDDSILAIHSSDSSGNSTVYTSGKFAERISIVHMGYKSVEIPMKKFWGKSSTVEITLVEDDGNSYNQEYKIDKFFIRIDRSTNLVLEDLKGNQLNLIKVKVPNRVDGREP